MLFKDAKSLTLIFTIPKKPLHIQYCSSTIVLVWGCGSVGRAMRSQRIGQGFESPHLHHIRTLILIRRVSTLAFLFCTPQPSKGLDFKAFGRLFLFSAVCRGASKSTRHAKRQGGNCSALCKWVLKGCSPYKREYF